MARWAKALTLGLLIAYGAVSVAFGVRNAMRPAESQDLARVYMASRLWMKGHDPYRGYTPDEWTAAADAGPMPDFFLPPGNSTPYSPIALLDLTPIAGLDWVSAKTVWLAFNLLLAACVPFIIARLWYSDWSAGQTAWLFAIWCGGIGLRVGLAAGQHALFWLACTLMALLLGARRRPGWAGVSLALSLHKFQLSTIVIFGLLAKRTYRPVVVAALVAAALTFVFLARLPVAPGLVATSYFTELRARLVNSEAGGIPGVGVTHLHPVLVWLTGSAGVATMAMYGLVAVALVACAGITRASSNPPTDLGVATWLLLLLWGMYHGVYDTVVLIVPIAALMDRWPDPARRNRRLGIAILLALLLGVWFTDASRLFRTVQPTAITELREVGAYRVLSYFYRTTFVALFAGFIALQWQEDAHP